MDPTARLVELLASPCGVPALDEAALLVAAHDHDVDVAGCLEALDALASRCAEPTVDAVVGLLFATEGFRGDSDDYHHPDNSFLDRVLERRRGLPILLAVLAAEVGARAGVCLAPVGMPGHFLLRDCGDPDGYLDPFHGGRRLDRAGCEAIFRSLHPGAPFRDAYLDPIGARPVLLRLVTNLVRTYSTRGPIGSLAWALHLRALLADDGDAWQPVARVRERIGDWDGAAAAWQEVGSDEAATRAAAVQARTN